jgi:hypothetical protein
MPIFYHLIAYAYRWKSLARAGQFYPAFAAARRHAKPAFARQRPFWR